MGDYPDLGDAEHNVKAAFWEVEFENVFSIKDFYKLVHEWFVNWGYSSVGGGEKEVLYLELVGGTGAKNQHIWWRVYREDNAYFKYFIRFDIQTLNLNSVEIMHKGKKVKTTNGDMIVRAEGYMMLDYRNEWKKNWFLKLVDEWFTKRAYRKQIEDKRKQLWFEVYNLQDTIKQYLELNTPYEKPEPWVPNKGLN